MGTSSDASSIAQPPNALVDELTGGGGGARSAFHEPAAVEAAGKALAARVAHLRPEVLLSSDQWRDVLLGHVVARELEARTTHIYDAQGTVELSEPLSPGARCLLVAAAFEQPNSVHAALAAIAFHGGEVVAVGALSRTEVLEQELGADLPVVDLARA